MNDYRPCIIENRDFVKFEEEDIQRLNREETGKFDRNPKIKKIMREIEMSLVPGGHWEEHWLTVDNDGRRVYARIYYTKNEEIAIVSDGRMIRKLNYPNENQEYQH